MHCYCKIYEFLDVVIKGTNYESEVSTIIITILHQTVDYLE